MEQYYSVKDSTLVIMYCLNWIVSNHHYSRLAQRLQACDRVSAEDLRDNATDEWVLEPTRPGRPISRWYALNDGLGNVVHGRIFFVSRVSLITGAKQFARPEAVNARTSTWSQGYDNEGISCSVSLSLFN